MPPPVYSVNLVSSTFVNGGFADVLVPPGFCYVVNDCSAVFRDVDGTAWNAFFVADTAEFLDFTVPPFGGRAFSWRGRQVVNTQLTVGLNAPGGHTSAQCDIRVNAYKLSLP